MGEGKEEGRREQQEIKGESKGKYERSTKKNLHFLLSIHHPFSMGTIQPLRGQKVVLEERKAYSSIKHK